MKITVLEAAYIVLCPVGPPLHQDEIAKRIRRRQLKPLLGETPGRTVGSAIYMDIKKPGVKSRFEKAPPPETFKLRKPSSVIEAADIVLCAAGKPLHYKKITERIVRRWPRLLGGETPGDTVGSAIRTDIKKKGVKSRFVKTVLGTFGVRGSFSVIEAAYVVLREVKKPLHQKEIAKRVLSHCLRPLPGKTPDATVRVAISNDIKKYDAKSRFKKVAPGTFGLRGPSSTVGQPPRGGSGEPSRNPPPEKPCLTFKDAAFEILTAFGKPMRYQDITEQALKEHLIDTKGKTPANTMSSILSGDIQHCKQRGERSRFVKSGRGKFGLFSWKGYDPEEPDRHTEKLREKLLQWLLRMPPECFETLIAKLLVKMGFDDVGTTNFSRDGGIDVRGVMVIGGVVRMRMAVQAKRWANKVSAPVVRDMRGSLEDHEQGLIITTSGFSDDAQEEAELPNKKPVWLMKGEELVSLLFEYELGVRRRSRDLLELDSDLVKEEEEGKGKKKGKRTGKRKGNKPED